jgi:hypothetical protein
VAVRMAGHTCSSSSSSSKGAVKLCKHDTALPV